MENIKEFEKNLFKALTSGQCGCISSGDWMHTVEENKKIVQRKHIKAIYYYCDCWDCRRRMKSFFKTFDAIPIKQNPNQLELITEENFFDQFQEIGDYFPEEVKNK